MTESSAFSHAVVTVYWLTFISFTLHLVHFC